MKKELPSKEKEAASILKPASAYDKLDLKLIQEWGEVFSTTRPLQFEMKETKVKGKPSEKKIAPHSGIHKDLLLDAVFYNATGSTSPNTGYCLLNQAAATYHHSDPLFALNTTASLMQGIQPKDTVEGMLATQMVSCHQLSMLFAKRVLQPGLSERQIEAQVTRATKLMNTFTRQVEALTKYRNKGKQTIQVQHIQVSEGGQAVIGNVNSSSKEG